MRITDEHGHRWPVTGHRCPVCGMPADPTLDGGPHTTCAPTTAVTAVVPPPADEETLNAALALLSRELGATPARPCIDCGHPLPDHAAVGVTVHVACWMVRPGRWRAGQSSRPARSAP